tara:strand:- start:1698 stop:2699 length:1002 start_codon:yes stop_codon:yes gene_type:complete
MAFLRSIKTNDILNSDERTEALRNKNLYITGKTNGLFIKNKSDCLVAVNSYENKLNISRGHNLVASECRFKRTSINPIPIGKLNQGNFLQVNLRKNKIINSITDSSSILIDNKVFHNDPLKPPWNSGDLTTFTRWDSSGVLIDPSNIYINKKSCNNLISLKDPNKNNYYNINDYTSKLLQKNNILNNFSLSTKISFEPCENKPYIKQHFLSSLENTEETSEETSQETSEETSEETSKENTINQIIQKTPVDIIDLNNNLSVILYIPYDGTLYFYSDENTPHDSPRNVSKGIYTMNITSLPSDTYDNACVKLIPNNNSLQDISLDLNPFTINNC